MLSAVWQAAAAASNFKRSGHAELYAAGYPRSLTAPGDSHPQLRQLAADPCACCDIVEHSSPPVAAATSTSWTGHRCYFLRLPAYVLQLTCDCNLVILPTIHHKLVIHGTCGQCCAVSSSTSKPNELRRVQEGTLS